MNSHLGYSNNERGEKETVNRRNGYSKKTLKQRLVTFPLKCHGIVREHLNRWLYQKKTGCFDIQDKVLSMYAKGMSQRDIADTIEDIYGFISHETISEITDSVLEQLEEWQTAH